MNEASGASAKRKRGPASIDGAPNLKQPRLLDCLFDSELSPIQATGTYMYVYALYIYM